VVEVGTAMSYMKDEKVGRWVSTELLFRSSDTISKGRERSTIKVKINSSLITVMYTLMIYIATPYNIN